MATRVMGLPGEVFAGLLLAAAAVAGILFKNIGFLQPIYDLFLNTPVVMGVSGIKIDKPLLLWINDGLMAIFFLLVALEIKREIVNGSLSKWSQASLPVYGAIGGIVVPAIVFLGIVGIDSAETKGWAIPAATDIAFALGVLSLFGKRVPPVLKTFLLTLAVVDDLAAIVIIALFYTSNLSLAALGVAAICTAVLAGLNVANVYRGAAYIAVGLVLWVAVLKSGVHATLAGVVLGFMIPLRPGPDGTSLAQRYEHGLHSWVSFLILPIFAFSNAGVPLAGLTFDAFLQPLALGIAAGLFIGKQIGVFGAAYLSVKYGLSQKPDSINWKMIYGAAMLAGIGFTMSLFIGSLAFDDVDSQNAVRLGVISGSLLSGIVGAIALSLATRNQPVAKTA